MTADQQLISLELCSYTDSMFTNAHDLVDPAPVHDGRGTFTHLGVRMEGLESGRHFNFCAQPMAGGSNFEFCRDPVKKNVIVMRVVDVGTHQPSRAVVKQVEFDTKFFTRNNVRFVYSLRFLNEDLRTGKILDTVSYEAAGDNKVWLELEGDAIKKLDLTKQVGCEAGVTCTRIILECNEGGLTRFRPFGSYSPAKEQPLTDCLKDAQVFGASDASYGDPSLVLRPCRQGKVMAGWESCRHSARHRLCLKLHQPCIIRRLEIDTYMHCLNPFRYLSVLAFSATGSDRVTEQDLLQKLPHWTITAADGTQQTVSDNDLNDKISQLGEGTKYSLSTDASHGWRVLLPMNKLERDSLHEYSVERGQLVNLPGKTTHLAFIGIPDGGLHRIAVQGEF